MSTIPNDDNNNNNNYNKADDNGGSLFTQFRDNDSNLLMTPSPPPPDADPIPTFSSSPLTPSNPNPDLNKDKEREHYSSSNSPIVNDVNDAGDNQHESLDDNSPPPNNDDDEDRVSLDSSSTSPRTPKYATPSPYVPRRAVEIVDLEEEELNDINDPGWNEERNLTNDEDRRIYGMRKFGNRIMCNPTVSMTFHGFRRLNLAQERGFKFNRRAMYSFDGITDRAESIKYQKGCIIEMNFRIQDGAVIPVKDSEEFGGSSKSTNNNNGSKKRKRTSDYDGGDNHCEPLSKRRRLFDNFESVVREEYINLKKEAYGNRNVDYYLRHFDKSFRETSAFLEYYSEVISRGIEDAVLDMENIYSQYANFYGKNFEVYCKDCIAKHPY